MSTDVTHFQFDTAFLRKRIPLLLALIGIPLFQINAANNSITTAAANSQPTQTVSDIDFILSKGEAHNMVASANGASTPEASSIPPAQDPKGTPSPAWEVPVSKDNAKETAASDAALNVNNTTAESNPVGDSAPASQNTTINLINRLVQKGILTKEDAAELIKQAEADADLARSQTAAAQAAAAQAAAAQVAATQAAAAEQNSAPPTDDAVRVTYIPETVKSEIRDQIKQEVMTQAREERWAAPRSVPSWLRNFKPAADLRVRYEGDFFPQSNDDSGSFPNFNAINTGAPFDVSGNQFSPQYNVNENRNRFRIRARFGADMDLGENYSMGFRLGTGETNSPVTENQTIGLANQGQGGNFSKYSVWIDRAFLKYQIGDFKKNLIVTVGRFDNPFFTTSTMQWAADIGFDGVALMGQYEILRGFTPFFTAGVFPIFNTDLNFATNNPQKFQSYDKYLYAVQGGSDWKISKDFELKTAVAYYYFQNVEGQLSTPYVPLTPQDAGDTDDSRPSFAQKGNTYMAIRDILPVAANNFGTIDQFQYYGLATPYQNITVSGRLDYKRFEPVYVSLLWDFVDNVAFNQSSIDAVAVNNRGPTDTLSSVVGPFVGGNIGWNVELQVGDPLLLKRWNWNVGVGYRYVESDAVVDGFNDSDFGGGGTNLKGYIVKANLALSSNVWLGVKWLSATSIAGPSFKEDIFQFDVNARF
ncbi:MAG: putative porin [Chthoniobacterales bacterium]